MKAVQVDCRRRVGRPADRRGRGAGHQRPDRVPRLRRRPGSRRAGAGRAGQAARRLAGHRRPRPGRRRRLRPPRRPRQGPDHPRRSQHRPRRHRERAAGPPRGHRRAGGGPSGRPRRRGAGRLRHPRPRRQHDPRGAACLGLATACPSRPRRPRPSPCWTRCRSPPSGKPFKPALRAEATREAVAEALRDVPARHRRRGVVEDGAVVAVVGLADGADETSVKEVLDRFAITWRLELS